MMQNRLCRYSHSSPWLVLLLLIDADFPLEAAALDGIEARIGCEPSQV